jgi:hypothetical protein
MPGANANLIKLVFFFVQIQNVDSQFVESQNAENLTANNVDSIMTSTLQNVE